MALFTQSSARACIRVKDGKRVFYLGPDDKLTPSAREWLAQEGVEILSGQQSFREFKTLSGAVLREKPEHMTHLRGNVLVEKDHPRIVFRGCIDRLEAEILLSQKAAAGEGRMRLVNDLEEVLDFVRKLIRADVLDESVGQFSLLGLDAAQLREQSHHPEVHYNQPHFMPSWQDPASLLALNKVRTVVRDTERAAYDAFRDQSRGVFRNDILMALNRLSSLLWILEIRVKAGYYPKEGS